MIEGTWFWSHGFKVRSPEQARYTQERMYTSDELHAMSWVEQINAFLKGWNPEFEEGPKPVERMAFILNHGLEFQSCEEMMIDHMTSFYYVSVLLPPRRAVEFTLRWDLWMEDHPPRPK